MYTEVKTKEEAKEKVCSLIDEDKVIQTVRKRTQRTDGSSLSPKDREAKDREAWVIQ